MSKHHATKPDRICAYTKRENVASIFRLCHLENVAIKSGKSPAAKRFYLKKEGAAFMYVCIAAPLRPLHCRQPN